MRLDDMAGAVADLGQAIQLDPQNASFYVSRGDAHYIRGELRDALSDYQTSVKIPSIGTDDYPRFYMWMIQEETALQMTMANKELSDYLHRRSDKTDGWSLQIGRFLIGELSQVDFLKTADCADEEKSKKQHCEAYFYVGMKYALMKDAASARLFMQQSLGTGRTDCIEYKFAQAWLRNHPEGMKKDEKAPLGRE